MTDATTEVRRLLDERGVEWRNIDLLTGEERDNITEWDALNSGFVEAKEVSGYISYVWYMGEKFTPAQAIDATLGRGECHDKNGFDRELGFECTACGAMTDGYMVTTENVARDVQFHYCPFCGRRVMGE